MDHGIAGDGPYPNSIILGSDGNFYGTTQSGGLSYFTNGTTISTNYNFGTIFKITPDGQLTTLYKFGAEADHEAFAPVAALVEGSDGRLYGTTEYGGDTSVSRGETYGTIFAITTNGAFTYLNSFASELLNNGYYSEFYLPDGGYPTSALVQGNDGTFYGTTTIGGIAGINVTTNSVTNVISGYGTVFKIIPSSGQITVLYTFGTQLDAFGDPLDGATPNALIEGTDGNLYGSTQYGGANDNYIGQYGGYVDRGFGSGDGTLFRISPTETKSFTNLLSFDEKFLDGYYPFGPLIPGPGGVFFGGVSAGGANNRGAVFIFNSIDSATNLVWLGNSSGEYGPNLQSLVDFQYYSVAYGNANPVPSLLTAGRDGNLYGTTTDGGANGNGTVYVLNISAASGPPLPPVIQSVTRSGQSIEFSWSAIPGSMYQAQYTTNLLQSGWANLGSVTNAIGTTLSATDSIGNSQRFYRIELLQ